MIRPTMMCVLAYASLFITAIQARAQGAAGYAADRIFAIAGAGGWDYLAVNGNRLYVSHGSQVNVLDKRSGDSLGIIPHTEGVHGIAFDVAGGKGYTSNGKLNNVTVFNLHSLQVLGQIATGQNPDAILYDPYLHKIVTCNGRSHDLSVIDPSTQQVIATIAVGGKPETAVTDGAGKLYVNIEDKSEIIAIDLNRFTVLHHWPVAPGQSPTGLAIDRRHHRLFAGCDNRLLVVMDDTNGRVVTTVPIGDGCDGVAFDTATHTLFAANGEGTLSVIRANGANSYTVLTNAPTKKGARTLALDEATHTVYLPTADFLPATGTSRPPVKPGSFQVWVIPVGERNRR